MEMSSQVLSSDHPVDHSQTQNNADNIFLHELVKMVYFQPIYLIALGNVLAVIITLFFLWGTAPTGLLSLWAAIMFVQSTAWSLIVAVYRRKLPAASEAKLWIRLFPLAATLLGVFWGLTTFLPNVLQHTESMVFLSIMVLGVTAAGLALFAPYLRSFVSFAGIILVSFAVHFFMQDSKLHWTLGIMFLLYLTILLISGYNMKRAVKKSIELRLENLGLVDDLILKNQQAEQARELAEQADISKSKFLAAASHDLRQPLHALGLFVDALESRITYPETRSIVDNIRISTDALGDLFNALLDISKLDAGVLEASPIDFNLSNLLKRIQTDFNEPASNKSLNLNIIDCDFVIHSDPSMLERILRNLVSNAIRYTTQGDVLLECHCKDDRVIIEIRDTGMGIAAEEMENIFDEFYQVENPERDRRKGLGLGLAIVKRLSDLLDCSLSVESSLGEGSVFQISVPYVSNTVNADINTQKVFVEDMQGIRVLIIDDEAMIRVGMSKVLEEWGCTVQQAESIEQALSIVNSSKKNYSCAIDIILTDYRLRENTTGIDVIHAIHAACNEPVPAIILTGDTAPERLREAKDSGFKLLHKPVSPAKLRSLMSYQLEHNKS